MKKGYLYIILWIFTGSWLVSCEESEPPFYDKNSNGTYFDYEKEKLDTLINFANYILEEPQEITLKLRMKLLGYVENYDRKLVLKASALEDFPLASITCPEIIIKAGEYRKEIEIRISRPETQDIRYGAAICVDEEKSDIGTGAEGFENFTVYVENSYSKPENWDKGAQMFFGAFTAEKHILIVKVTKDENYVNNKNPWGTYPDYQLAVIDSIRHYNQEHADAPMDIAIPFIPGGPVYPKPYYWTEQHDKYLGEYDSNRFISLCGELGIDTSNEAEKLKADEKNLKNLHKKTVQLMMNTFNNYFSWGEPSYADHRSEQIPMFKDVDYDVVEPVCWREAANLITPYYGEYSEAKYKFMINTLLTEKGDKFYLPEMFPVVKNSTGNPPFTWDTKLGGEPLIKDCQQLFYKEWEKNKDKYDFTFPVVPSSKLSAL